MTGPIVGRVAAALPVLVLLTLLVWFASVIVPGDPAVTLAGETATPEQIETIRQSLNLDDPVHERFIAWAGDAVRGDLGKSFLTRRPVTSTITARMPVTISLTVLSLLIAVLVAVPLGTAAALRSGSLVDKAANLVASLNIAVPSYWLAGMLVVIFSLQLDLLPSVGYVGFLDSPWEWFQHLLLPAVAASSATVGVLTRQVREAVSEQLGRSYVRTARAYGASDRQVVTSEVLKNASIPIVTTLGIQLAHALGGTIIVEKIFSLPGLGTLAIDSVVLHDLPMIQGIVLFIGVITIVVNLCVDLSYSYLAPWTRA